MRRIDSLFRSVSVDLHRLIMHIEAEIRSTESAQQVLSFLELLEEEVGVRRRQRRKDAATILERLRRGIEKIPIRVTDALFVDLKRGVFALDMRCDYHPGDPVAETRDRMAPAQFINGYEAVAVSPSLYQQWLAGSLNRRPLLPERQGSLELDEGWFAGGHAWDTGYAHPPPPPHVGLSVGHGIGRADGRGAGWYSLESSGLVDW